MPQLSSAEQNMIDDVTRRQKRSGADACRAVNTLRVRKQIDAVSVTTVHNYINGATHARAGVRIAVGMASAFSRRCMFGS